jgi:hypothetical protein
MDSFRHFYPVVVFQKSPQNLRAVADAIREKGVQMGEWTVTLAPYIVMENLFPDKKQLVIVDDYDGDLDRAEALAAAVKKKSPKTIVAFISERGLECPPSCNFTLDTKSPDGIYGHLVKVVQSFIRVMERRAAMLV